MQELVNIQRSFFDTNATKPIKYRISLLKTLKKVLKDYEMQMIEAVAADFGKSEFDTLSNELLMLHTDIKEYCRKLKCWSKPKPVCTNLINFPARSYIVPEPYGVTLIIGAWNYPFQLAFAPAIAALAAGNTVILKPSELAPHSSAVISEMVSKNFDKQSFAVVEGGINETTSLLACRFDKIFFTGSPRVGKIVYQAASKNLTPVTLELGGKSPVFVTETANLDVAVKRIVWAKFLNAGQTCIAPDYFLVHKSIKSRFLHAVKAEIEKSNFALENGNYTQIVNDRNMQRVLGLIDSTKVWFGGSYDLQKRLIEPTILDNVEFTDKVMQEEIFGPIMPIIEYEDLNSAIRYVKSGEKPLSCYVLTSNKKQKEQIIGELSFGGGCVNEAIMHITTSNLPFGGVGNSGIGSYHGKAGFDTFTHYKSILEKPLWFELPLKFSPYTKKKCNMVRKLM